MFSDTLRRFQQYCMVEFSIGAVPNVKRYFVLQSLGKRESHGDLARHPP